MLITHIVEVIIIKGKQTECKGFFNVKSTNGGTEYVSLREVVDNNDYKTQIVDKIIRHLEATTDLLSTFKKYLRTKK